ncbi:hypothetical protein Tco_0206496 [Tanacetum coccineum]
MAERTMEELLRAPTEGYGEAIVLPEINADHFEIKTNMLQLVQANPFHGLENENHHAHINSFKRITSTLRFRNVPNDVIKLMMFPYSLEGAAKTWYEKEPPNSILTWEDLVTKFGEYDIWAMKMGALLGPYDYPIWEVIQNGNGPVSITTDTSGQIKVLPPRTAEEIVARERKRKARTTLVMALH